MNNKLNLPPFYIGEKVVYIGETANGYIKNKTYIVTHIRPSCGCSDATHDVSLGIIIPSGHKNMCVYCGHNHSNDGFLGLANYLHKSLEEAQPPLLTFSKIKEVEKEEILILN